MDTAASYRRRLEALIGIPATAGNRLEVLRNGDEIFPAMLEAIRGAEHSIDLLTYIYWSGKPAEDFAAALSERARRGVRVRVLLDAVGARLMDQHLVADLLEAGALVEFFRPLDDVKLWEKSHRTHRRALVVDGEVGFTGGVGIAGEWQGDARNPDEWRDTHVKVTGPAVNGIRGAFLENWAETGHPLVDDGPVVAFDDRGGLPADNDGGVTAMVVASSAGHGVSRMSILKRVLIDLAEEQVNITSAYLAPESGALDALQAACERDVQVRILVPGDHIDKRVAKAAAEHHFETLLDLGARVFTFQPTMLHAKTMTVDGQVADVGSANFNSRSVSQDEEIDLVAFGSEVAGVLDEHFAEDLERATEITPELWEQRGPVQRMKENAVGLFDGVM